MSSGRPRTDRIAEDTVANLCRAAGATVQKVSEDDHGWDLLVEFPPLIGTAFPDLEPPLTRCLIQVKSTVSRRRTTRVKLSNAVKFAKDRMPCFVVLLTFPGRPEAYEAIYLRHVWAADMEQALKAARLASFKGLDLNRQHVSVAFTTAERTDHALVDSMLEAIGRVGTDYAIKKKAISESLGYEAGWGEGQFVLADGHDDDDLQDLLLGLRDDLPIQSFRVTEARFGIKGPVRESGPGRLSITLEPRARCVISLQRRDTGERLTWTGGLFVAGMDWLEPARRRARILAGPLDVQIDGAGHAQAEWSAPLDEQRPLDELEQDATFRSWMDGSPLDLEVWTERGSLSPFTINFDRQVNEVDWAGMAESLKAMGRVVPPAMRPSDLTASMRQLGARSTYHSLFARQLAASETTVRIDGGKALKGDFTLATHMVFPWVSQLNNYYLVSVIEREIVSLTQTEGGVELSTVNGRLLRGTAMKISEATNTLVSGEVQWARDRARNSNKRIISFHPDEDGTGTLIYSADDEPPKGPPRATSSAAREPQR